MDQVLVEEDKEGLLYMSRGKLALMYKRRDWQRTSFGQDQANRLRMIKALIHGDRGYLDDFAKILPEDQVDQSQFDL